jgi:hypothetical protein
LERRQQSDHIWRWGFRLCSSDRECLQRGSWYSEAWPYDQDWCKSRMFEVLRSQRGSKWKKSCYELDYCGQMILWVSDWNITEIFIRFCMTSTNISKKLQMKKPGYQSTRKIPSRPRTWNLSSWLNGPLSISKLCKPLSVLISDLTNSYFTFF